MTPIKAAPLPKTFLTQMQKQLGEDFFTFAAAYEQPPWRGVRTNLLKSDKPLGHSPTHPIPWCAEGLAFRDDLRLGQTLAYLAGLFYLQEPSAMSSAAMLDAQPGERVLDLCAAPGGKTTQIAGAMQGQGLLVANDASPTRIQALVRNLERAGVRNAVVTTEQPRKLAERFAGFFDRVLVDAPCSGEGMFRRDADVVKAYTANKPEACAAIQLDILRHAATMVRPGGRLVYSTCTFNTVENEGTIEKFLAEQNAEGVAFTLAKTKRIWPHKDIGEGHFVAVMTREMPKNSEPTPAKNKTTAPDTAMLTPFKTFCQTTLSAPAAQYFFDSQVVSQANHLYLQPESTDLRGLRVARAGWHLGEVSKGTLKSETGKNRRQAPDAPRTSAEAEGRFTPSQGLAMGLRLADARYVAHLSEADAWRYTRGESLDADAININHDIRYPTPKPWVLVGYNGHPLGWARWVQGRLKNQLPTGWVR
ncbi:MAG: RsmB/NOP family class I SAM-dependent RNA methyltransferase [Defluviitaleaceae bacterium]|nr:RsmB/NOP family class I SAM-dependent RNA methyltransferase [Defluviitaleaceae bacterium]